MEQDISTTSPCLLFDYDEIMIADELHCMVVTGEKTVFRRRAPKSRHTTLGLCVSPFGDGPPPLFVFPSLGRITEFAEFETMGTLCPANSANGWATSNIFEQWTTRFVVWLDEYRTRLPLPVQQETAVLLLDNSKTHCVLSSLTLLAARDCKVASLPLHLTHVLQPIDVACTRGFGAALAKYLEVFRRHPEYLFTAKGTEASRARVIVVLEALSSLRHCSTAAWLNGCATCGIYPWSPEKALKSRYVHDPLVDPKAVD
jgi:hypothetical protein